MSFEILAGKYDCEGENCKYSVNADSFDEAISLLGQVRYSPWARIESQTPSGTWWLHIANVKAPAPQLTGTHKMPDLKADAENAAFYFQYDEVIMGCEWLPRLA